MKVSAVIPHYGDPAPTLTLIEALRAQQGIAPDELEIIVSDDQSPVPFPDTTGVRVVRRETNGGRKFRCCRGYREMVVYSQ